MSMVEQELEMKGQDIMSDLGEHKEFKMEVRYYYDESLLKQYGSHTAAKNAVREMHEHAKVMMRHPTIGRPVHLLFEVEPSFVDKTHSTASIKYFKRWLESQDL